MSRKWTLVSAVIIALLVMLSGCSGENDKKPGEETVESSPTDLIPTEEPTEVPLTYISAENVADVELLQSTTLRNEPYISCVEFSPVDANSLVSWSYDNILREWDVSAWSQTSEKGAMNGLATAFSPDGSLFAAGIRGYRMFIFNTEDWSILNELTLNGAPHRVAFIDDERVAVGSPDISRIEIFNVRKISPEDQINSPLGVRLAALDVSPDLSMLAFGDARGGVFVKDIETRELLLNVTPTSRVVMDLVFSADGTLLAAAHDDGSVVVWDTRSWEQVTTFMENGNLNSIPSLVFSKDGSMIITAGDTMQLTFFSTEDGSMLRTINLGDVVWSIDLSPDGDVIAVGMNSGRLVLYGLSG